MAKYCFQPIFKNFIVEKMDAFFIISISYP